MPQLSKAEIEGLLRTFPLYVRMPKRKFSLIRQAEQNTPKGNIMFKKLAKEYQKKYW